MALTGISLTACAPKVMILQSPVVSMTKDSNGANAALPDGAPVSERWCQGDKPIVENDDGSNDYGMIDQVVLKAQKKTGADFFKDARFYEQGNCVMMNAKASGVASTKKKKAATKG